MVDWIRLEGAEVMQRLGRWQEVTAVVDRVRSGAVMGAFGHLYEITFAVQLAMQGRYEESEQHLKKAEEIAPAIRDPQAIAAHDRHTDAAAAGPGQLRRGRCSRAN